MINVWGTFCGPCIREMPDLARISESHKNSGVEVVGVVIDVTEDDVIVEFGSNRNCRIPMKKSAIAQVEKADDGSSSNSAAEETKEEGKKSLFGKKKD